MPKTILYRLFVTFFDTNNQVFCKTNSSGKTLDTRQKILCASLDTPDVSKALFKNFQSGLLVNCLLKCSFKNFLKYSLWMFMQWSLKCSLKYTSYCSFLEVILQRFCKVLHFFCERLLLQLP